MVFPVAHLLNVSSFRPIKVILSLFILFFFSVYLVACLFPKQIYFFEIFISKRYDVTLYRVVSVN